MIGPSSYISKFLLTILFLIILWYLYMDFNLYLRIQNYPIDRSLHFNINETQNNNNNNNVISSPVASIAATNTVAIIDYLNSNDKISLSQSSSSSSSSMLVASQNGLNQKNYEDVTWISCDINPLCHITVKAIMLDHTNQYLFAPLATICDNIIGFSKSEWITANMISYFHVFVAIAAGRLIASDNLSSRRIGVCLFQFRTFLDDLDGHVARQKKHIRGERSEIGTSGYYIDGICDALGCIALIIGIFIHLKNNPPRRGYTQLKAIIPIINTDIAAGSSDSTSSSSSLSSSSASSGVIYKVKVTTKKVTRKILCFAGQLLLSSTGWNRYIALYQDMLERDSMDVTVQQYEQQTFVFKSQWFFSIAWCWRVVNVHALLHCVLLSIFCDKLWEFLRLIQYAGFVTIIIIICVTEMHAMEVQNFIYKSFIGYNNTSL